MTEDPTSGHGHRARQPFHVLAKPIGPICNLDCRYCFYLDKKALFPQTSVWRMRPDVLDAFVRQYIEAQPPGTSVINFAWQGGEPTLLGVDFFREALALQARYARPGVKIENAIQTNGTLLDDAWGRFLAENRFLVGLSIDGPREMHDGYRLDKRGRPTFDAVMRGLEVLKRHRVEFNTLTVLHDANVGHPEEVYDFLTNMGSRFLQFIPLVMKDENTDCVHPHCMTPNAYGGFLNGVLDHWLAQKHVGKVFVQDFDVTLSQVMGYGSPLCVHAETCGRAVAVEHDGSLYSCDHYVLPEHRIGNVLEQPIARAIDGAQQTRFGLDKRDALPRYCRACKFVSLCNGGCPKDRIVATPDGEPGLNYLCEGFQLFYAHALPVFEKMARCLRAGATADQWQRVEEIEREQAAAIRARAQTGVPGTTQRKPTNRNAPCPCGSGLKYKKCCGR